MFKWFHKKLQNSSENKDSNRCIRLEQITILYIDYVLDEIEKNEQKKCTHVVMSHDFANTLCLTYEEHESIFLKLLDVLFKKYPEMIVYPNTITHKFDIVW